MRAQYPFIYFNYYESTIEEVEPVKDNKLYVVSDLPETRQKAKKMFWVTQDHKYREEAVP